MITRIGTQNYVRRITVAVPTPLAAETASLSWLEAAVQEVKGRPAGLAATALNADLRARLKAIAHERGLGHWVALLRLYPTRLIVHCAAKANATKAGFEWVLFPIGTPASYLPPAHPSPPRIYTTQEIAKLMSNSVAGTLRALVTARPGSTFSQLAALDKKLKGLIFLAQAEGVTLSSILHARPDVIRVRLEGSKQLLYPPGDISTKTEGLLVADASGCLSSAAVAAATDAAESTDLPTANERALAAEAKVRELEARLRSIELDQPGTSLVATVDGMCVRAFCNGLRT